MPLKLNKIKGRKFGQSHLSTLGVEGGSFIVAGYTGCNETERFSNNRNHNTN